MPHKTYKTAPVVVEALRYGKDVTADELAAFLESPVKVTQDGPKVLTPIGEVTVRQGEWLVRGITYGNYQCRVFDDATFLALFQLTEIRQ